jgi:hypothetical protein
MKIFMYFLIILGLVACETSSQYDMTVYTAPKLYSSNLEQFQRINENLNLPSCPKDCLQMSENADMSNFFTTPPTGFTGFTYQENFKYKLRIRFNLINGMILSAELLEQIEKTPAP